MGLKINDETKSVFGFKDEDWSRKNFARYLGDNDKVVIDEFDGLNGAKVEPMSYIVKQYVNDWSDFCVLEGITWEWE